MRVALAALLGLAAACSVADTDLGGAREVTFPDGFLWGSATAGFQIERGLPNTDWGVWAATEGKIAGGDHPDVGGPDALAHVAEDVAILARLGQSAYRFSIEWARLYPTRAAFDEDRPDPEAIAAYDRLFAALRAAAIRPMVTLQHFALPDYLSDPRRPEEPQGWEREDTVALFPEWCARVAARWGGEVDWWATINEPIVSPLAGYVAGTFPPGRLLEVERGFRVAKNEVRGHARCYDAIKRADVVDADGDGAASRVGIVHHLRAVEPEDPSEPADQVAAERVRYVNNTWLLEAAIRGNLDDDLDGRLDGPTDRVDDPELRGRSDWLGVNYYSALVATSRGIRLPIVDAFIKLDHLPTTRPKTDFGWDIYPEGLGIVLAEVAPYGLPVIVTENGIADASDANRGRFVLEHLFELGRARDRLGLEVLGYFYWSLLDNFEWADGFCPRFGLASVDRATARRGVRPSAEIYAAAARSGRVTRAEIDRQPPYAAPTYCE